MNHKTLEKTPTEIALARIRRCGLDLSDLDLKIIPREIMELVWLKEIKLSGNRKLEDISALSGLNQLTDLDLSYTQVSDLSALSGLSQLTNLDLSDTKVSDLSRLSGLSKLTNLDLSNTLASDLSAVSDLSQLTDLDLSITCVSDLSALSSLSQLTHLDLSDTKVSDLSTLSGLSKLTNLSISSTSISDLSALSNLSQLTLLILNSLQISDLSALSGLSQLTDLRLSNTKITDLSALSDLSQLTVLLLSNTQVNDLSPLLPLIKKGIEVKNETWLFTKGINIEGCPLSKPPIEVIEQGHSAVLTYFEDLETQGSKALNEAKLIIVGEPEAGKTTLMECLLDPNYQLSDDSLSTLGIEVREGWQFALPSGSNGSDSSVGDKNSKPEQFSANIWAFGGQQIQYLKFPRNYAHKSLATREDSSYQAQ